MRYQEFIPSDILRPYVQCYFACETDTPIITEDKVFATGHIEIMFNIGDGAPQKIVNDSFINAPDVQLWGQTIQPLTFTSFGKHAMLGVRFFTHTAACFFNEPIEAFNDQMLDFCDVAGAEAKLLHSQLSDAKPLAEKIELIESFLLARLSIYQRKLGKLKLVASIMQDLNKGDFFENINSIAARYGISSRYLQKIFLRYSGLSPNLSCKIARFQKTLPLVTKKDLSLTQVAYTCGYYDQSHFIKDFKYFTGSAPSLFSAESSTDLFVSQRN